MQHALRRHSCDSGHGWTVPSRWSLSGAVAVSSLCRGRLKQSSLCRGWAKLCAECRAAYRHGIRAWQGAHPLLPGLMAASVWMPLEIRLPGMLDTSRPSPLTTPVACASSWQAVGFSRAGCMLYAL